MLWRYGEPDARHHCKGLGPILIYNKNPVNPKKLLALLKLVRH